jgi:hypothetical protein
MEIVKRFGDARFITDPGVVQNKSREPRQMVDVCEVKIVN